MKDIELLNSCREELVSELDYWKHDSNRKSLRGPKRVSENEINVGKERLAVLENDLENQIGLLALSKQRSEMNIRQAHDRVKSFYRGCAIGAIGCIIGVILGILII